MEWGIWVQLCPIGSAYCHAHLPHHGSTAVVVVHFYPPTPLFSLWRGFCLPTSITNDFGNSTCIPN